MTYEEICVEVSRRAGAMTPAEWADFFAMPQAQQEATARLYKGAIFEAGGEGTWAAVLDFLGAVVNGAGVAAGIAQGVAALRGA